MKVDLKQVRDLARMMRQFGLDKLEVSSGDESILLRRGDSVTGSSRPSASDRATRAATAHAPHLDATPSGVALFGAPPPASDTPAPTPEAAAGADPTIAFVTSPFVGTFYRSASPESSPFVEIGQEVQAGQVLCIVEAMKLMNEIEAEVPGVILEALVATGNPVEYGERLFKLRAL